MLINLGDPAKKPDLSMPLLQLGFRPFFLLAGISASLLILVWGFVFTNLATAGLADTAYGPVYWHGHEMIFGFVVAVIAGFLLTAVKNWTGRQTAKGPALLALVLVWLCARVLPFFPGVVPYWLLAVIDLSFLPLLAATLSTLLVKTRNYRNLIFIGILLTLAAANGVFHLGMTGLVEVGQSRALYAAVYIVLLLISIMGGRVIPFFIERGLAEEFKCKSYPPVEIAATALLLLLGLLHSTGVTGIVSATVAFFAALSHLIRLSGWYSRAVWRIPLLWVLVLAYGWLVMGLFLMSLSMAGLLAVSLALHTLTIGAIGLMTMGMMVRVSMGHSGRKLVAPELIPAAFAALNFAVVVRVVLPIVLPGESYTEWVFISAIFWTAAFAVFAFRMSPIFMTPRVDGRLG